MKKLKLKKLKLKIKNLSDLSQEMSNVKGGRRKTWEGAGCSRRSNCPEMC